MDTSPAGNSKEEGLRLLREGKLEEAIAAFNLAAKADPQDAQIHTYLAVAYNKKNDKLHAIAEFETSAKMEETPQSLYNLGQIYEVVHRVDEAIWQYQKALTLDPAYTQAKQAMDRLHAKHAAAHPAPAPPQPTQVLSQAPVSAGPPVVGSIPSGAPVPTQAIPAQPGYPAPGGYPPGQSGPPDFRAEMARKQFEVEEQHRVMVKSGLIYGIICGAGFFFLLHAVMAIWFGTFAVMMGAGGAVVMAVITGTIKGAIFGGLVGFWVGHTCGGGGAGFMAGAVVGLVYQTITGLIVGLGAFAIISGVVGAVICGFLGYIIGELVDNSIGQI